MVLLRHPYAISISDVCCINTVFRVLSQTHTSHSSCEDVHLRRPDSQDDVRNNHTNTDNIKRDNNNNWNTILASFDAHSQSSPSKDIKSATEFRNDYFSLVFEDHLSPAEISSLPLPVHSKPDFPEYLSSSAEICRCAGNRLGRGHSTFRDVAIPSIVPPRTYSILLINSIVIATSQHLGTIIMDWRLLEATVFAHLYDTPLDTSTATVSRLLSLIQLARDERTIMRQLISQNHSSDRSHTLSSTAKMLDAHEIQPGTDETGQGHFSLHQIDADEDDERSTLASYASSEESFPDPDVSSTLPDSTTVNSAIACSSPPRHQDRSPGLHPSLFTSGILWPGAGERSKWALHTMGLGGLMYPSQGEPSLADDIILSRPVDTKFVSVASQCERPMNMVHVATQTASLAIRRKFPATSRGRPHNSSYASRTHLSPELNRKLHQRQHDNERTHGLGLSYQHQTWPKSGPLHFSPNSSSNVLQELDNCLVKKTGPNQEFQCPLISSLMEYQRCGLYGGFSASSLLQTDYAGPFSDENGSPLTAEQLEQNQFTYPQVLRKEKDKVRPKDDGNIITASMAALLPSNVVEVDLTNAGCWKVDEEYGGVNGWQYSFNWNTKWSNMPNALTYVRKRRWIRIPDGAPEKMPLTHHQNDVLFKTRNFNAPLKDLQSSEVVEGQQETCIQSFTFHIPVVLITFLESYYARSHSSDAESTMSKTPDQHHQTLTLAPIYTRIKQCPLEAVRGKSQSDVQHPLETWVMYQQAHRRLSTRHHYLASGNPLVLLWIWLSPCLVALATFMIDLMTRIADWANTIITSFRKMPSDSMVVAVVFLLLMMLVGVQWNTYRYLIACSNVLSAEL